MASWGSFSLPGQVATNAPPTSAPEWTKPIIPTNPISSPVWENHPPDNSTLTPESPGLSQQPLTLSPAEAHAVIPPPSTELADHLLVVYNQNDPDSKGLADYYATRRNIPTERVLAIATPTVEEITREQYEDTIREPIESYLFQRGWMTSQPTQVNIGGRQVQVLAADHNDIWAIVLMRGVPLKIAPDPNDESSMETQPVFQTDAAAVDNELALLPIFGLPKGGYVPNMFYDSKVGALSHVGPDLAKALVLVTRLDGPTPSDVRRMIDDTLYAEQNRLAGLAVIDTRGITDPGNNYIAPDNWLRSCRDMLMKDGWLVKFDDDPNVLPPTDPCNHVALYLGWYRQDAYGPWITPPDRFVRGAIAYHLHSFSAVSVRDVNHGWVAPFIAHGAVASMGTVYEPYLELTPHFDIFAKRLLAGDYFAEAAYASSRCLSWMTTVVGDPLYRPFRRPLAAAVAGMSQPHTDHDDWLLLQQVQRELVSMPGDGKTEWLQSQLDVPGAGMVAYEGLGDLLQGVHEPAADAAIEQAYLKALGKVTLPIDRIRVGLKLADYYDQHALLDRARAERDVMIRLFPEDAKRFGVTPSESPNAPAPMAGQPTLPMPPQPPQPPKPGGN